MATSVSVSGSLTLAAVLQAAFSGDTGGGRSGRIDVSKTLDANNVQVDGFLKGSPVCAAGDWLLGHATDPFQAMGDAGYSDGLVANGKKIKLLVIVNKDSTHSITISRKTLNGLPFLNAADDAFTIPPGGFVAMLWPSGLAALVTGTNDGVTIAVSGGTPIAEVLVAYGS